MFFADDGSGKRIEASPGAKAVCPLCKRPVMAKCGEMVEWHWAHEQGGSCDSWSEAETPWHRWWKNRAPADQQEVVMGDHRADIRTENGVIELQHSYISADEIRAREEFYGKMIWVLDGRSMVFNINEFGIDDVPRFEKVRWLSWAGIPKLGPHFDCYRWRRPKASFVAAKKRVFIDLGDQVVEVAKMMEGTPDGFVVVGHMQSRDRFLERLNLRPVADSERNDTLSYMVRYLPKDNYRGTATGAHSGGKPPSPRWREFGSLEQMERWEALREPDDYEVFVWVGSGDLCPLKMPG